MTDTEAGVPEGNELKKEKPFFKKRVGSWLLVIIALIMAIGMSSCGGGNDATVSGEGSSGGDAASAGPSFQGQTDNDTSAEPGQTITLDDVAITSAALFDGDSTLGATLCTTVTIVNNGDDSQSFNPFDYML